MKVLLINAPFEDIYGSYRRIYKRGFLNPPLHLCYVAAAAEKAGHTANIIDGEAENLSVSRILDIAKDFEPDIFGVTATSIDFSRTVQVTKALKKTFPNIPIILGGTHINIFGKEVLEDSPEIDYGCVGDGEDFIQEFLFALSDKTSNEIEKISGLVYRKDGEVIQNSLRPAEKDIDHYAFPARHLLKNELYYRSVPYAGYQKTTAFMSSRGCPYKCVYCAVEKISGGNRVRLRSAENVLEELEYIVRENGITHVAFNDDCLTLNKNRIFQICEGIRKRDLKLTWEGLSRADLVDKELLTAMKEAGFIRISYGIESGNPEMLKVLQKHETLEQIEHAFIITKEAGIITRGSVIIGAPYETRETVKDTFRFIRRLKGLDQVVINVLQPYPGTKVRDMILKGEGGARFITSEDDYGNLQRFGSASIAVNDLTSDNLVFLQRWGFFSFYMRPRAIWNNLKITGLQVFLRDGLNFMRSIVGL